tara:strand:+ start:4321 stop:5493 length:1173 start_codon:yes stop_codon:yes gene_type:complete
MSNLFFSYKNEILIFLFVTFNALLCVGLGLNVPVNSSLVILVQALLFVFLCFWALRTCELGWIDILLFFYIFIMSVLSLFVQDDMVVKDVFSMLILPISLLYFSKSNVNAWFVMRLLFFIATFILILEVFLPELLIHFFPVGEYFLKTRDWVAEKNTVEDVAFYIGSVRPGGYYFIPDVHRVGSIFLEPITYSYFSLLVILSARVFELNAWKKGVYVLVSVLAIILTDSRIAIFLAVLFSVMPLRNFRIYDSIFFYFIGIMSVMVVAWLLTDGSDSELPLRLGYTFNELTSGDAGTLLGLFPLLGKVNDSGYLLYISILGLPGLCILFLWIDRIAYVYWVGGVGRFFPAFYILLFVALFFGGAILSAKIIVLMSALVTSLKPKNIQRKLL